MNPAQMDELDDEGFLKFIEEALGDEFDQSMIEEFRTSDFFDEFVKSLGAPTPSPSSNSRRNSLNGSEKDTKNDDNNARENLAISSAGNAPTTLSIVPSKPSTFAIGKANKTKKKSPPKLDGPSTSKQAAAIGNVIDEEIPHRGNKIKDRLKVQPPTPSKSKKKGKKQDVKDQSESAAEDPIPSDISVKQKQKTSPASESEKKQDAVKVGKRSGKERSHTPENLLQNDVSAIKQKQKAKNQVSKSEKKQGTSKLGKISEKERSSSPEILPQSNFPKKQKQKATIPHSKPEKKQDASKFVKLSGNEQSTFLEDQHQSNSATRQKDIAKIQDQLPTLLLVDLKRMHSVFPTGLRSPMLITATMLEKIRVIEREIRSGFRRSKKWKSLVSGNATRPLPQKEPEKIPGPSPNAAEKKSGINWPVEKLSKILDGDTSKSKQKKGREEKLEGAVKSRKNDEVKDVLPAKGASSCDIIVDKKNEKPDKLLQKDKKTEIIPKDIDIKERDGEIQSKSRPEKVKTDIEAVLQTAKLECSTESLKTANGSLEEKSKTSTPVDFQTKSVCKDDFQERRSECTKSKSDADHTSQELEMEEAVAPSSITREEKTEIPKEGESMDEAQAQPENMEISFSNQESGVVMDVEMQESSEKELLKLDDAPVSKEDVVNKDAPEKCVHSDSDTKEVVGKSSQETREDLSIRDAAGQPEGNEISLAEDTIGTVLSHVEEKPDKSPSREVSEVVQMDVEIEEKIAEDNSCEGKQDNNANSEKVDDVPVQEKESHLPELSDNVLSLQSSKPTEDPPSSPVPGHAIKSDDRVGSENNNLDYAKDNNEALKEEVDDQKVQTPFQTSSDELVKPTAEEIKIGTPQSSSPSLGGFADDDLPQHDDYSSPPDPADSPRKSPSPDRIISKKKNVIESSSDDGDGRKDTCEDTDATDHDHMKSSDEEPARKRALPFERKKEKVDSRTGKFDKFEHERQRKMSDKKKEKEKSKDYDPLEDILKEKPLSGSFRIPKKTNAGKSHHERKQAKLVTPLASAQVPKENLQFERFRKGSDKKEKDNFDFRGPRFDRGKKEPGPYFRHRHGLLDDGRQFSLLPAEAENKPEVSKVEVNDLPNEDPEPLWGDDGDGGGASASPGSGSAEVKPIAAAAASVQETKLEVKPAKEENSESKPEKSNENKEDDPEVPVEEIQVNQLAIAMVTLMDGGIEVVQLPNVDTVDGLYETTVMKLAWWFVRCDFENAKNENDNESDDGASDLSFLAELSDIDVEDDFYDDFRHNNQTPWTPQDEYCGRALLNAKFRSGPDDKFERVFQIRSGGSYDKENFQAYCTLCKELVVGRQQLASHILGEKHGMKMSSAGGVEPEKTLGDLKPQQKDGKDKVNKDKEKDKEGVKGKVERDKKPEAKVIVDGKDKASKDESSNHKRKTEDGGKKDEKSEADRDRRSDRRKRSREREDKSRRVDTDGAELTKTSTGLSLKIPPGAFPDKNRSNRSRSRSRSRSPRQKRARSRSPRRRKSKSRSRSPTNRDRRRRSRTPVQRILREPRRRTSSEERVQKFLEKTNSTRRDRSRSRSPRNSHSRKRQRRSRSRSRSKSPAGPVMPKRNNKEFHEKLALTAEGKWTDDMEKNWKLMEAEEAIFMEQFGEKSKMLNDVPEKHPRYADEWTEFWERRFSEVEQQGRDPETYDYVPEWKEYWSKRLRDLLDLEFESGSLAVKKKFGMDCETLRGLRQPQVTLTPSPVSSSNQIIIPNPVSIVAPLPVPSPVIIPTPVPAPVPAPGSLVLGLVPVPAPAILNMVPTSLAGSNPIMGSANSVSNASAKSFGDGEDMTARSMSISDGGSVHSGKGGDGGRASSSSSKVGLQQAPITAGDVISQWEKLRSGQSSGGAARVALTSNFAPSKSSTSVDGSNNDSGSIDSIDFSGFGLVEVLRLMSAELEDQLSFFADKVKDYYKTAEELDLRKRNKSMDLLNDEDFVVMLSKIRDRFLAMIRAGILKNDVLRKLNLIASALKSLLEHPLAQKHRSKFVSAAATMEKEKTAVTAPPVVEKDPVPEFTRRPNQNTPSAPSRNRLSGRKKKELIAKQLTEFVLSQGRSDLNDNELRDLIRDVLSKRENSGAQSADEASSAMSSLRASRTPEVTKTCSIATSKVVGNAMPYLPAHNVPLFHMNMRKEDNWNGSSSESMSDGNSPFSRRNYSGNPLRDKDVGSQESQPHDDFGIRSPTLPHSCNPIPTDVHAIETPALMNKAPMRNRSSHASNNRSSSNPLTRGRRKHSDEKEVVVLSSSSSSPSRSKTKDKGKESAGLPPGILQLIIKERNARSQVQARVGEDDSNRIQKQSRRQKIKRSRRDLDEGTSDSSSESERERNRRKSRKKYQKKRKKKSKKTESRRRTRERSKSKEYYRRRSWSKESESESSRLHFPRRAPPEDKPRRAPPKDWFTEDMQENRPYPEPKTPTVESKETSRKRNPTFIPEPPLSVVSSQSSKRSVTITAPSHHRHKILTSESDWEKPDTKTASVPSSSKQHCDSKNVRDLSKVTTVSETFWTAKDDDAHSLCSISSAEVVNKRNAHSEPSAGPSNPAPIKTIRQLRKSKDHEQEKEPGEVSSSD